jgi:anthranilate synthase component 2
VILLIDNYDSFVFNLARYLRELGCDTEVVRNDSVTVDEVRRRRPEAIVLSPGPCTPTEAGICVDLVRALGGETPILGVCLGHQAIAAAYGAAVVRAPEPVHGRTAKVVHNAAGLLAGLPQPLTVGRYHSLIVDEATLPAELEVTCRTSDGLVMGLAHRRHPVFGVQFHPESVLTQAGHQLLRNFLALAGRSTPPPPAPEWIPQPPEEDDFFRQPIQAGPTPPW